MFQFTFIIISSVLLIILASYIIFHLCSTAKIKVPSSIIISPTNSDCIEQLLREIRMKYWGNSSFSECSLIVLVDHLHDDQIRQLNLIQSDFYDVIFCYKKELPNFISHL